MTASIIQLRPLFVKKPQAAEYLSLSESTFDRLVAQGKIAKPRKVSDGCASWFLSDLDAYGLAWVNACTALITQGLPLRRSRRHGHGRPMAKGHLFHTAIYRLIPVRPCFCGGRRHQAQAWAPIHDKMLARLQQLGRTGIKMHLAILTADWLQPT